jgi:hypothetical protein
MSTTYSLDHVVSSTESVLVEVAAKSEFVSQGTVIDPKTGARITTYTLGSGDSAFLATVEYRIEEQVRAGQSVRRVSMTFRTWATSDDGLGLVVKRPVSGQFAFVLPIDLTIELADLDDFIGNCFSFLYASQSSGARATGYLNSLLFGSSKVV